MSVETHRVLMGACGWKHQAWLDDFYSENLPEEWQLGFYSNEFPVVYIPANDWINTSGSDLVEWTEDVSDSFRFILEVSAEALNDESRFATELEKVKSLDAFCLGLVFQLDSKLCENITLFNKNLLLAKTIAPVCIDSGGNTLSDEINNILFENNISEVWNGISQNNDNLNRGTLAISHVSGENLDMVALRNIVEGCLAASNENRISVLCIDGNPPSLELLRNADIILNLL